MRSGDKTKNQLLDELAKAEARIAELEARQQAGPVAGAGESLTDDRRFRYIIDASPVACAVNDENRNITYLNPAFVSNFGYDLNDIPTLSDWWPRAYPDPEYRAWVASTWQERLAEARRDRLPFKPLELNIRCKDGSQRIAMVGASPLAEQMAGTHLVTLYDITERRQTDQELARHRHHLEAMVAERTTALEDANQELESFAYSVSHDLRAPLRAIDGFSQVLLEDYAARLDDAGKDCLYRIRNGAQRMGRLIDDLLALSRVTSCELRREDIDLSQMAQAVIRKLREYDPQRIVEVEIAPVIAGHGDARLIDVVLDNLLGNAWKYTGRTDRPRVAFDVISKDDMPVYRVRDNGIGFDMKYASKLFGPFQRLHKPDEFEGTGIGLATVARIIYRHGGKIWCEADVDRGATFYFTLGTHPQ